MTTPGNTNDLVSVICKSFSCIILLSIAAHRPTDMWTLTHPVNTWFFLLLFFVSLIKYYSFPSTYMRPALPPIPTPHAGASALECTLGLTTGSMKLDLVAQYIQSLGFGQFTEIQVLNININVLLGFTGKEQLICLSKLIMITGAACFSPKDGTIEQRSLRGHVEVGTMHTNADNIQALLTLPVFRAEEVSFSSASVMTSGISP